MECPLGRLPAGSSLAPGEVLSRVDFPVSRVSSCIFGGPDLKTLFVTTAKEGLSPEERRTETLAGSVFSLRVDVPGFPLIAFATPKRRRHEPTRFSKNLQVGRRHGPPTKSRGPSPRMAGALAFGIPSPPFPEKTVRQESGAVACDHYHRWKGDFDLLGELGVDAYRFSISWSRVFPEGTGASNPKGIAFYDRLVDGLLDRGIDPCATLYHWDLPQALQDRGGWGNRDAVGWFEDYAEAMFGALGDRVKTWFTHNEPWVVAWAGHYAGRHAPGATDFKLAVQVCHHLLLAHAGAIEAYRGSRRGDGKIGAVLNLYPTVAASESPADVAAARLVDGYHNRWWLDPILKGDLPRRLAQDLHRARRGSGDGKR